MIRNTRAVHENGDVALVDCFGDGEPVLLVHCKGNPMSTIVLSRDQARLLGEALLAAAEKGQ